MYEQVASKFYKLFPAISGMIKCVSDPLQALINEEDHAYHVVLPHEKYHCICECLQCRAFSIVNAHYGTAIVDLPHHCQLTHGPCSLAGAWNALFGSFQPAKPSNFQVCEGFPKFFLQASKVSHQSSSANKTLTGQVYAFLLMGSLVS